MVNMRERAERIDGSLRVESSPGRGTSVMLVVPLVKNGKNGKNGKR
jgi:signal transduction histidine kinase